VNQERQTQFRIEPLGARHNRATFSCGVETLDRYLQKQASQDTAKRVAAALVATPDGEIIAGFYTLSAHVVNLVDLPTNVARRLARYPNVPATLLAGWQLVRISGGRASVNYCWWMCSSEFF
jgi:hypothetical protein